MWWLPSEKERREDLLQPVSQSESVSLLLACQLSLTDDYPSFAADADEK